MNKLLTSIALLTISFTALADTSMLEKNLENLDCESKLQILIDKTSEANRLSELAILALGLAPDERYGHALNERARSQIEQADLVRKNLIRSCFKK